MLTHRHALAPLLFFLLPEPVAAAAIVAGSLPARCTLTYEVPLTRRTATVKKTTALVSDMIAWMRCGIARQSACRKGSKQDVKACAAAEL